MGFWSTLFPNMFVDDDDDTPHPESHKPSDWEEGGSGDEPYNGGYRGGSWGGRGR